MDSYSESGHFFHIPSDPTSLKHHERHHRGNTDDRVSSKNREHQPTFPLNKDTGSQRQPSPETQKIPASVLSSNSPVQQGLQMPSVIREYSERGRPTIPFAERRSDQDHNASEDPRQETQRPSELSPQSSSSSLEPASPLPKYRQNSANGDFAASRAPYGAPPSHQLMGSDPSQVNGSSAAQHTHGANSLAYNQQGTKRSLTLEEAAFVEKQHGRKYKRRRGSKGKQAERWDAMFQRLCEFRRIHGHCLVPNRYPLDPSLGAWVSTQRRHYKVLIGNDDSVTTPMTPERAAKLMSIGFQWATKDPRHVPWEHRFQELLAYKEEYGDCVVPIGFKENPRLSNWVSAQRQEYKLYRQGRKCRITAERVAALDAVGFVWEAQRGSSLQQQKKKKMKDAKLGKAAQQMLSLAAARNPSNFGQNPPPNNPPQHLPPHLINQILAILGGESHSKGSLAAQRHAESAGAAAARRMEDAVALQRLNDILPPPPSQGHRGLPGLAHHLPPPHESTLLSRASIRPPASHQAAVSVLQDAHRARHLHGAAAADLAATIQNQDLPNALESQIITRHLVNALRGDHNANAMGIDAAVAKIHGILGIGNRAPVPQISQNEAQTMALRKPPPPLAPPSSSPREESKEPPTEKKEEETEASKFGVALQVGDMLTEQNVIEIQKQEIAQASEQSNVKVPPPVGKLDQGSTARDSIGLGPSLAQGLEIRKQPVAPFGPGSGQDRLAGQRRISTLSNSSGPGSSSDGPISLPHASVKRSLSTDSEHSSGGVFSDAEEDETAAAFLAATTRRFA